jgi:dimeric dUTPase (all-alpha-NTP-PPase superfamily)
MNLEKLFETQKVLRERINYRGEDRFNKLVLALLVELGECANEWRGFKFWSKDQEPRYFVPNPNDVCKECKGQPIFYKDNDSKKKIIGQCDNCDGCGVHFHNPLLEEYVDSLHFILELGIEMNWNPERYFFQREKTTTDSFLTVIEMAVKFELCPSSENYSLLFERFKELGEHLGFTWEEVEQAYYDKNRVNHQRQEDGY